MSPKVSVIVPVYNVQEYLGQCLDTILLQTLQDIEVICVDDGSTDNSLEILNTYAFFDERIKVIHQENAGLGPARNRGLQDATGEFVIFLDSDDFFHPEMLEKMVAKAEEDGSDIVRSGGLICFDNIKEEDYAIIDIPDASWLKKSPIIPQQHKNDLFFCFAYVPEQMFLRSFLIQSQVSFFNLYQEDIPFTYTLMTLANKISLLSDTFCHYRKNREGSLISVNKDNLDIFFKPWELLWKNLEKRWGQSQEKNFQSAFLREVSLKLKGLIPEKKRTFLNSIFQSAFSKSFALGDGKIKISLIVCSYNGAEFLPECLDSCLNQTLKEIEIICVDDGSTDDTLKILNDYAQKDARIKVIHQENKGLPISRNNAMKIANGEYIQFLDADDWIEPDTCVCLYLYAKVYGLDMLSFAAKEFKNTTNQEFEEPYHCLMWLPEKFIPVFTWQQISNVLPQLAVTSPLTIYRHQYLLDQDITWINKKVAYEDTPFFTESLLKCARMGALPVHFYHKRVHENAITQNMNTNFSDYCWIVEYTLKLVQKLSNDTSVLNTFINGYLTKVYLNYQKLSPEVQEKMTGAFCKLCFHIVKKYRVPLSDELNKRCYDYLKTKSLKKRLGFFYFSLLANWSLSGYAIRPINIVVKPDLTLSVFGISLFKDKIKNFLRKKIHYQSLKLDDTQLLAELKKMGRFAYIPNPGNMGDMVISSATIRWFNKNHLKWYRFQKSDVPPQYLVYGGGGWVDLWINGLGEIISLMKNAKKIVILPSSFYNVPEFVKILDERFVVFCREKKSYDYLIEQNTKAKVLLDHDMAFRLNGNIYENEPAPCENLKRQALYLRSKFLPKNVRLFRQDPESKEHYESDFDLSVAIESHSIYEAKENIDFIASMMFEFLDHFTTIQTDRLHVAIVAALLGKNVILYDNSYGKIKGVYHQTLSKFPNVKLIQDKE